MYIMIHQDYLTLVAIYKFNLLNLQNIVIQSCFAYLKDYVHL